MANFNFDQVDQVENTSNDNKITFLKLQDDGWYAKVRFMYGPGESFEGQTVHNVSEDPKRPKYVPCLREIGQPLDSCPLCKNGSKVVAQFFIPVYVISIVSNVRGVQQEEPVNQVMLFQRGTTFKGSIGSVIRQSQMVGKPIVSCIFNLVRNGKAGDQKTNYSVELAGHDNTTLDQLPPRPEILGSYILPNVSYQDMIDKYINGVQAQPAQQAAAPTYPQMPTGATPRTINANTFAGNTVTGGYSQPGFNQAPAQAPNLASGSPF